MSLEAHADEHLALSAAVGVGRVEEVDPFVPRLLQHLDGLARRYSGPSARATIAEGNSANLPTAESDICYCDSGSAKHPFFHQVNSSIDDSIENELASHRESRILLSHQHPF